MRDDMEYSKEELNDQAYQIYRLNIIDSSDHSKIDEADIQKLWKEETVITKEIYYLKAYRDFLLKNSAHSLIKIHEESRKRIFEYENNINCEDNKKCAIFPDGYDRPVTPFDIAIHMKLLGNLLTSISRGINDKSSNTVVIGVNEVLLDSLVISMRLLLCALGCIPQLDSNIFNSHTQKKALKDIQKLFPGI